MKHIKEAIVAIIVCLVLSLPAPVYAESLQEVLTAQTGIESIQEENSTLPESFTEIYQEHAKEKLEEIQAEIDRIAEESEQAKICQEQTVKAQPIVNATYNVPTTGGGWCAAWVSQVYQAAGFGYSGGNACDMYWNYCTSSNREDIIPGMIIAVPSHTGSYSGSIYGHVGIIVAHDGQYWVRHNVGPIIEVSLDEWIAEYGDTYEPKWGFAAQI